ncbi:MAG: hypothetical protein HY040_10340 [Planctomycetes bacterium]|nr:hypothetical protein [Planctomycetota bacterium]
MQDDKISAEGQVAGKKIGEFHERVRTMGRFLEKPFLGCLFGVEDCAGNPIRSHTLSESWLRRLADDGGHVLQFVLAVEDAGKRPVGFKPKVVGVGEATTFPGFCQEHDDSLFACVEKEAFVASPRQLACLVYRSVCQEICVKHQMLKCNLPANSPDFFAEKATGQFRLFLELMKRKLRIEEMLRLDKYALESYVVEFERTPTFLVATTFLPYVTFTGRELERRMDWVTLTILPGSKGGFVVFSWDKASPKNGSLLLKSLKALPNQLVTSGILHLALEVSENLVVSQKWWDSLPEVEQSRMLIRFGRSLIADVPPPPDTVRPAPKPTLDWRPIRMGFV